MPSQLLGLYVSPNPSIGEVCLCYVLSRAKRAPIRIYDVRGRVIRSLVASQPTGILTWDGTDASGRKVSPGVYFIWLTDGDRSETKRVTLIR